MARILFLYSTVDGHTLEICRRLARRVEEAGHAATVRELDAGTTVAPGDCDRLVIGASIRYGHHRPEVARFIDAHLALLESLRAAFFSVNVVARKPGKRDPDTNPYVRKFLRSIRWRPALVGIFAGRIDYPSYGFFDRTMIRLIMWMTHGPTDPRAVVEFTDWEAVDAFATRLAGSADPAG